VVSKVQRLLELALSEGNEELRELLRSRAPKEVRQLESKLLG
jgi:hypothetical protein